MPYPIRAALIISSDAAPWAEDVIPLAMKTLDATRNWYEHETGYTFNTIFEAKRINRTMLQLQENDQGVVVTEGDNRTRDEYHEGLHEGRIWEAIYRPVADGGFGWHPTLDAGPYRTFRHLVLGVLGPDEVFDGDRGVIGPCGGGGGWAGGRQGQSTIPTDGSPGEDYGQCIYGNWDWRYFVTGLNSPANEGGPYDYGRFPTLAKQKLSGSSAHEASHAFGQDSHNPPIWLNNTGDGGDGRSPMTAAQKQQFINNNRRFIEPKVWNFSLDDMAGAMQQQSLYKPEYDFTYEGRITSADLAKASAVGVKAKVPTTTTPPIVVRSVKELLTSAAADIAEARARL